MKQIKLEKPITSVADIDLIDLNELTAQLLDSDKSKLPELLPELSSQPEHAVTVSITLTSGSRYGIL